MNERSERGLREVLARGDTTREGMYQLMAVLLDQGKVEEARQFVPWFASVGDSLLGFYFGGVFAAKAGDRRGATGAIEAFLRVPSDDPNARASALYNAAAIAALAGDAVRAMDLLREARRAGWANYYNLHQDTDLVSLRGTPAFVEFSRPRK